MTPLANNPIWQKICAEIRHPSRSPEEFEQLIDQLKAEVTEEWKKEHGQDSQENAR